jgi:poly(3-hydroxybutyrate) depolymerase
LACLLAATLAPAAETGFLNRSVTVDGEDYRYVVYVPRAYNAAMRWPVILFLHGSGESGTDGLLQTELGLPRAVRRHPERFPAVIVMPQADRGKKWSDAAMEKQALAALDASAKEFHGDPERTYLTGLSLGGYGTWSMAANNPGRFAALVPVCGAIVWPGGGSQGLAEASSADPYAEAAQKIGSPTPVCESYSVGLNCGSRRSAASIGRQGQRCGALHSQHKRIMPGPNDPLWRRLVMK